MKRSLDLTAEQRTRLLDLYRGCPDPEVRFRSHILLLLGEGHTWVTVATLLYCSSRTIDRWVKRFHAEGVEAVARPTPRPPPTHPPPHPNPRSRRAPPEAPRFLARPISPRASPGTELISAQSEHQRK